MTVKLANNSFARLAAPISDSDTTLVLVEVEAGTFPTPTGGAWHPVTVSDGTNMEVMKATARAAGVLTVERGQEDTVARAFAAGAIAEVRMTAAVIDDLQNQTAAVQANVDSLTADIAADLTTLEGQIATKASQAALDAHIASTTTALAGKASQADFNTLSTTVAGLATSKANQSDLTTLQAQVNAIAGMPTGMMFPWPAGVAPTGALMRYGQGLSTTTYAALFAVIGYTFGGSGGTFNLPDTRGRTVASPDNLGGSAASRLTTIANAIGSAGGAQSHTLTTAELPAHNHTASTTVNSNGDHSHGSGVRLSTAGEAVFGTETVSNGLRFGTSSNNVTLGALTSTEGAHAHTASTTVNNSTGGGGAHNNVQPTIVIPWAIKT